MLEQRRLKEGRKSERAKRPVKDEGSGLNVAKAGAGTIGAIAALTSIQLQLYEFTSKLAHYSGHGCRP
jgi:tRNA(Ile2) C34 agmatinyltransferase TiaS